MEEIIIDLVFTDFDKRHNFTNNKHPRKPDGHFLPTPVSTHYEATHEAGSKKKGPSKLAMVRKRIRNARNRRKREVNRDKEQS